MKPIDISDKLRIIRKKRKYKITINKVIGKYHNFIDILEEVDSIYAGENDTIIIKFNKGVEVKKQ